MTIDPLSGGFVAGYAVLTILWAYTLFVSAARMRATRRLHESVSRLYLVLFVGSLAAILACANDISRLILNYTVSGTDQIEPATLVSSMTLPYLANAIALIVALCFAVRGWLPRIEREEKGQMQVKQDLEEIVASRTAELKTTIRALEEDRRIRENVETELRSKHAMLDGIMQTSVGGIVAVDQNGRIVFANAQAEKVLGVPIGDAIGREHDAKEWQLKDLHGQAIPDSKTPFRRVNDLGEIVQGMQVTIGWPDGSRHVIEVNGAPLSSENGAQSGAVFLVTDITQRIHDEEILRNSEKRFRYMVEDLPMGAVFVDGEHIRLNRTAEEITGYSREELTTIAQWFWALYGTRSADARAQYESFRNAGFVDVFTTTIARKDRVDRVIECGGYRSGNAIVWLLHDVTEKHHSQAERHRFQSHLLATQSLEHLAVMALGVANDCNNILTGILGTAELARHDLSSNNDARPYIEDIATGAERAADLCTMMMAYTGGAHLQQDSVDINAAVQEMVRFTQATEDTSTEAVRYELDESAPPARVDAAQIRKVLVAILRNAAEAVRETGGRITVSTKSVRVAESLTDDATGSKGLLPGEYVCVTVTDTGEGMDQSALERAYEPLFTTKPHARGLGLTYALGIVRACSGNILIQSEKGRGTTVTLYLPAAYASTIAEEEPVDSDTIWHGAGTVLVVDDEQNVREVTKRMLRKLGFEALLAGETSTAMTMIDNRNDISAVILDLSMPDMDGRRALIEIKRTCPGIPVLIASGYDMKIVSKRFPEGEVAGFIQKPFSLTALSAHLRNVLAAPTDSQST
ncbi:MAG: PAS domain S-box protein [Candidatus Hydrogenedentes bacterium]|nr:PAS domain S-box protein [Candidatus Hydrogenedentota bacterium]